MKKYGLFISLLAIVIIVLGLIYIRLQNRVTYTQDGSPVSDEKNYMAEYEGEVFVTDGVKHTVPLDKILAGGPPQDGIPPIDNPQFETVTAADSYLEDTGLGIAVSFNGVNRFYPFQVLVWHEIVNDDINGQKALITYCPLCGTGIVFDPMVQGAYTTFGTSGKLYQSNLVMYDRATESYWSQVLGTAIVGERAGTKLALLPHQNISWGDWKAQFSDGQVLSRETGAIRDYTTSPYGDYNSNTAIYFPVDANNDQYHPKELVWGLSLNSVHKAYPEIELQKSPESFTDSFAGKDIQITFDQDSRQITFIDAATNREIIPVTGFWFSWIAVHPESDVYQAF